MAKPESDALFDLSGEHSGGAMTRRMLIAVVGTVALYLIFSSLDLSAYGPNCARAVGFVIATIFWMIVSPMEMMVAALLIMTMGIFLKVFSISDVQSRLGASALYSLLGMMIVANSVSQTKFGERISYWVLYKFGQKPVSMVMLVGLVSIIMSAFVSNIATIVLLSSICNVLLLAMGEKPGESRLGKALMSIIPMGAMFGGCALITGAPTGALNGIAYMNTASGDLNLTVSYANWAKLGVPTVLICMVPMVLIYVLCFRIRNKDFVCPPPSYFKEHLDGMGRIGGSEIRWIVIVVLMVATMLSGMNTSVSALLFACISMLPGIGVTDCKRAIKSVPWGILICVCLCPLIGVAITNNGVSDLLADLIRPLIGNIGPLAFSIMSTTALFLAMNLMVNATHGAQALVISLFVPVCIALGYNPATCMLPTLLGGGWFWAIGANYIVMMNKGYGWWEMKDPILPGFLAGAFVCIVVPLLNYVLLPVWGMSYYL